MKKKQLNILFVTEFFPPLAKGGGEISCYLLARAMTEQGMDVTVLTTRAASKKGTREMPREEWMGRVKVIRPVGTGFAPDSILGNIGRELLFPRKLKKAIIEVVRNSQAPFDIVHYFNTNSILGSPGKKLGIPQVMHVNSPVPFCPLGTLLDKDNMVFEEDYGCLDTIKAVASARELGKLKNRWWLAYNPLVWWHLHCSYRKRQKKLKVFDSFIASSRFVQDRLLVSGISKKKTFVIPNIVETDSPATTASKGDREEKKLRLLYLGSLLENKGVLEMIARLEGFKVPYTLDLVGQGLLEKEIERISEQKGSHIKLQKPVPHKKVLQLLADHDILIIPSLVPEGFGRGVIESWSVGTPVVASDRGGLGEFSEKDGPLKHFDPLDPESLPKAIMEVVHRGWTAKAEDADLKKYRPQAVAEKVIEAYGKTIAEF